MEEFKKKFADGYAGWLLSGNRQFTFRGRAEEKLRSFDREIAEAALKENERRYRKLVQASAEGIWRCVSSPPVSTNLDVRAQAEMILESASIAECNDAFARQCGNERHEEMLGTRFADIIVGTPDEKVELIIRFIRSGYRLMEFEIESRDRFGKSFWALTNLMGDVENDYLVCTWGTHRDITIYKQAEEDLLQTCKTLETGFRRRTTELTEANRSLKGEIEERRQAEAALRASEGRYRYIFENSMDGILLGSAADGTIFAANPALCRMLGQTEEEVRRMGRPGIFDTADPRLPAFIAEREKTGSFRGELYLKRRDGSTFPCEITSSVFTGESGQKLANVIVRDITEQKRSETLLRIQRDLAISLGVATSMTAAFDLALMAIMQIEGLGFGCIYLLDNSLRELRLISHRGLVPEFVKRTSFYDSKSFWAGLALRGSSVYWPDPETSIDEIELKREGYSAFASIPIRSEGEVVSILNVGSFTCAQITGGTRNVLEAVAAQIGGIFARIRAKEALEEQNRQAEDVNSALRVLLRQLGMDRRDLEQTVTDDARKLPVVPNTEKSKKTRLHISQIEAVAVQIDGIVARFRTEERLPERSNNEEELNAALKILLKQRDEDRRELEKALLENVKKLILPCTEKLKSTRLSIDQRQYLESLERHLKEITSPFISRLSYEYSTLTPMEIRISDLLREGKTTKEIADILCTSERAVLFHRQNIRDKLGLKGRRVNLRSHLGSLT